MFAAISAMAGRRAQVQLAQPQPVTPQQQATPTPPQPHDHGVTMTTSAPAPTQLTTIDEIAKKLPPGMSPVYDSGVIVHNSSHLAAKCGRRHIQKYFISDVERGLVRECATCNGGTVFMRNICVVAENLLEVPFVLEVDRYVNPVMCITLVPVKKAGDDYRRVDGDGVTIYIHKTSSSRRITNTIAANLLDYNPCIHLRHKLSRILPAEPRFVEEPPDLPVIDRDVSERLCIDNT